MAIPKEITLLICQVCSVFLLSLTVSVYGDAGRGAFSTDITGTRARTFGEAFVAIADDANATRWNPAGLTSLLQPEFTFSHTNLFTLGEKYFDYTSDSTGLNQDFIGVAFPTSRFPIGISYLNVGTHGLITADEQGAILDERAGYAERLWTLSVGKAVARVKDYELAVGFNLNHYRVDARRDRTGIGIDGAVLIRTPRFFPVSSSPQIGIMLHGLTRDVGLDAEGADSAKIPPRINLGIAYRFLADQLTLAVGGSKTSGDSDWRYAVGGEYQLRYLYPIHVSVRGGYQSRGSRSGDGIDVDIGEWTVGGSVYLNRLKLDYSYEPHRELGDTHRMTISILQNAPTTVYWQRGLQHNAMLEDDAALEAFQQLIHLNPRNARAYHRMALIYERKRELAEAIRVLERVREMNPDYFAENGLQGLIDDIRAQR
ncbi:MAG: tetratricopeptide repeat protein [Candidatus Poribacteria bacterium]|nr:tetratricopeptide repeat protein [Candidatus Poribacteria bacterium]